VTPDGKFLIFQRSRTDPPREQFWILSTEGGEPRLLFESTNGEVDCARSPGSRCVFTQSRDDTLVIQELGTDYLPKSEIGRMQVDPRAYTVDTRLSPDGQKLLVIENRIRIRVLDFSTGTEQGIPVRRALQSGEWSVDGERLFVTGMDGRGPVYWLACLDLNTFDLSVIYESGSQWFSSPRTSPDGHHVAVNAFSWDTDFWMIDGF
jgi:WD40 repeat protein